MQLLDLWFPQRQGLPDNSPPEFMMIRDLVLHLAIGLETGEIDIEFDRQIAV
jgi:hypothetical protein